MPQQVTEILPLSQVRKGDYVSTPKGGTVVETVKVGTKNITVSGEGPQVYGPRDMQVSVTRTVTTAEEQAAERRAWTIRAIEFKIEQAVASDPRAELIKRLSECKFNDPVANVLGWDSDKLVRAEFTRNLWINVQRCTEDHHDGDVIAGLAHVRKVLMRELFTYGRQDSSTNGYSNEIHRSQDQAKREFIRETEGMGGDAD